MKKFLCVVMALALVLCLTACSKPLSEDIVGSWVTYIDVSSQMEVEGFETDVQLPIKFTFDEDGEVTMEPYEEEAEAAIDQLEADMLDYMVESFYVSMEESGYSREEADELYEAYYGMSVRAYFESYIESVNLYDSMMDAFTSEGEYEVDDEEMILEIDGDEFEVEIDGDVLTIVDCDNPEEWEDVGFELPQELTRLED